MNQKDKGKRILIQEIRIMDHLPNHNQMPQCMIPWATNGSVKHRRDKSHSTIGNAMIKTTIRIRPLATWSLKMRFLNGMLICHQMNSIKKIQHHNKVWETPTVLFHSNGKESVTNKYRYNKVWNKVKVPIQKMHIAFYLYLLPAAAEAQRKTVKASIELKRWPKCFPTNPTPMYRHQTENYNPTCPFR